MALDLMEKTIARPAESWLMFDDGERDLGEFFDDAFVGGGVVLHDRLVVDGSKRSSIDHLIIASSGVWVVDAYTDNHLLIGWSEQKTHVDGNGWQTAAVKSRLDSLGMDDVPVHRILCFSRTDWARRSNAAVIDGVLVLSPDKLRSVASQPGPVRGIDSIADQLGSRLPAGPAR